ncbi:hypothetical protein ACEWY4_010662 [Coilia grayii]|uniref:SH3 and multiple ankyrin repeat domains protein 3-like n=1 Tax=Coilia grayii TaxID=363190 RepID=A0ABD1K2K2_9TELE
MECVQQRNIEKVSKFLERGLDPNYHDPESGECPLSMAAQLEGCAELMKMLKSGGAHLDYRTKEGVTALHKAVRTKNHTALITLLDLGASPDYKDSRGLTALYHSAMVGGDPYCCELLLHDHAQLGCVDENGWQEIHQACRHGHVQHLEHLLFYGADMSAQNASGNTALHVCALYNQDSCARVLLFRGANKEIKNYNSQTAFQVRTQPSPARHGTAQLSSAQHSTAQHSTAQHSTAQHSSAQHSTAQHSTAQLSTAQHSTAQHSTAQLSSAQHSTAQHSTAQHSTAQLSTAQHSTAQHSSAQLSTAQHSTAQHSTAQLSTAQHSTAQHSSAQHSTAQHSSAQLSTEHLPFRETPSYTNRRRVTGTLTSPRSLLSRSASDNNLNGDGGRPAHSPVPSLRSLPPLAQPPGPHAPADPHATADGSLQSTGSSRSSHTHAHTHARSPSLQRVSEEPDKHTLRRHPHGHSRGRLSRQLSCSTDGTPPRPFYPHLQPPAASAVATETGASGLSVGDTGDHTNFRQCGHGNQGSVKLVPLLPGNPRGSSPSHPVVGQGHAWPVIWASPLPAT